MRIREFDYSEEDYAAVVRVANTVDPERNLDVDGLKLWDEEYTPPHVRRRFLAEDTDQLLGYGDFEHRHNMFHPQRFWLSLNIPPVHRGQGIGSQLFEHMQAVLIAGYDAKELHATAYEHDSAAIAFLTHCGLREVKRNWESRLETAGFDWTPYAGLEERLADQGIEIQTLSDLMQSDNEALYKVYELHQDLNQEVPIPAPRTRVDFDYWRDGYSSDNPHYIPAANFIALHEATYIGLSGIWGDPSSGKMYTGMTGVRHSYRRQGVATALKLRGIAYVQALGNLPLITHNPSDIPMLHLSLKLGFSKQSAEILLMKSL